MLLAEAPSPIDGLASAASVVLIIEVFIIILLMAVIMLLLAFAFKWLHGHVIPVVQEYAPTVKGALGATDRASGRVIDLVASLYARRRGFEEGAHRLFDSILPIITSLFSDRPLPGDMPSTNGHAPHPPTPSPSEMERGGQSG